MYGGDRFQPRHNLHPGHQSPVIVRDASYKKYQPHQARHEGDQEGEGGGEGRESAKANRKNKDEEGQDEGDARALVVMHWGLIPSWHKEGEKLDFFRAFNARSETIDSKPMFRRLVSGKRCIVCMVRVYVRLGLPPSFPTIPHLFLLLSPPHYTQEGFYEWRKVN